MIYSDLHALSPSSVYA